MNYNMTINKETNVKASPTGDPYLLTPGPLTTSPTVKQAMLHDYGSRDSYFIELNKRILSRLVDIVEGQETHVSVPLQGSGTFVVEAMVGNFIPKDGKLLICINGAYGHRIAKMCDYYERDYQTQVSDEDVPIDVDLLDRTLSDDPSISHVAAVYCETTSGILNPLKKIADVVEKHNRGFLIDAMSSFGALPISSKDIRFDAIVASSNKCLEGAPGMGFCIARRQALEKTQGNSPSLSLDLYDQWVAMEKTSQWRFTPPTHVLLALDQAITEFIEEGGVPGRGGRYQQNCDFLVQGMRDMGFRTLLDDDLQAPIIITFHMPANPEFIFVQFYDHLRLQGFVIYPGKLTVAESFRMGCIGQLHEEQMRDALKAVQNSLDNFGISKIS
jgi:2-aminoethylphosphonate-pyruvate transaminase